MATAQFSPNRLTSPMAAATRACCRKAPRPQPRRPHRAQTPLALALASQHWQTVGALLEALVQQTAGALVGGADRRLDRPRLAVRAC